MFNQLKMNLWILVIEFINLVKNEVMKYLFVFLILSFSIHSFGQDTTTILIDELEIMTEDLGKLNFAEATKACSDVGDGWRLPTKDEFNILCENREKIGGFVTSWYWSSTELNGQAAWIRHAENCYEMLNQKRVTFYVRLVRTKKQ